MPAVKIGSTGLWLPPVVQTAAELAPIIGASEYWIAERSGVPERRVADEPMEVMAARAARDALGDGRAPDCIINASATPVQLIPDSSTFIQRELGLSGIPSWSVHATCLSFLVATMNATALIQSGVFGKVLVVSSETATPFRNLKDPASAALFGDGAAAAVLEAAGPDDSGRVIDWRMSTWPEGAEMTEFRGAGTRRPPHVATEEDYLFRMAGPRIHRLGVPIASACVEDLLSSNGVKVGDIDWVVPHQASGVTFLAYEKFGFPRERIVRTLGSYGNTVAASIPMALAHADRTGLLKRGDLLLLGGTGAGLSVAFALLTW